MRLRSAVLPLLLALALTSCGGPSANERKITLAAISLDASRELLRTWSEDTQRDLYRKILTRGGSVEEAKTAVAAFRAARGALYEALVLGYGAVRDGMKNPSAWAVLNVLAAGQRVDDAFAALRATAKALGGSP